MVPRSGAVAGIAPNPQGCRTLLGEDLVLCGHLPAPPRSAEQVSYHAAWRRALRRTDLQVRSARPQCFLGLCALRCLCALKSPIQQYIAPIPARPPYPFFCLTQRLCGKLGFALRIALSNPGSERSMSLRGIVSDSRIYPPRPKPDPRTANIPSACRAKETM